MNITKIKDIIYQKSKTITYVSAGLLGLIVFVKLYGTYILNPQYDSWLLKYSADLTQHYLGWMGYRNGNWTFPIGNTNQLAYPNTSSVIFTDSIPLFAVFFKIFSHILPETFQYFGIWGCCCFILQAVLAAKIIYRFTDIWYKALLSSAFFLIAPIMINRMYAHSALAGQWILLLAFDTLIDTYKLQKNNWKKWVILGALCISVHAYFVPMCGIILVGDCIVHLLINKPIKRKLIDCILIFGGFVVSVIFFMWILGGFSSGVQTAASGFGQLSFNLNSLWNSQAWYWSRLIKPSKLWDELQYEGFNYLGMGMLLLAVFSASGLFFADIRKKIVNNYKFIITVFIVCIIALIAACSPNVTFGNKLLFILPWPEPVRNIGNIFRATGRFGWIIVYSVIMLSCIVWCSFPRKHIAVIVLCICIFVQIYDISFIFYFRNLDLNKVDIYEPNIEYAEYWETIFNNDDINNAVILDSWKEPNQDTILYITYNFLKNKKTINNFYFSRLIDTSEDNNARLKMANTSDIFISNLDKVVNALDYDLNYYFIDDVLIGYHGYITGYDCWIENITK